MGLLDGMDLPKKVLPCKVRTVLGQLEVSDSEILRKLLADARWNSGTLETELRKRGVMISATMIKKHRLGNCTCSKI